MHSVDYIYIGLMLSNFLSLIALSITSRRYPLAWKTLQYWAVIGLFIESFQWYVFIEKIQFYDCEEH